MFLSGLWKRKLALYPVINPNALFLSYRFIVNTVTFVATYFVEFESYFISVYRQWNDPKCRYSYILGWVASVRLWQGLWIRSKWFSMPWNVSASPSLTVSVLRPSQSDPGTVINPGNELLHSIFTDSMFYYVTECSTSDCANTNKNGNARWLTFSSRKTVTISMFWYFQDFVVAQSVGNLLDHFRHDLYYIGYI